MKPYVIGITGGSGSGKTTFIDRIKTHFDRSEICIVSQDNYYRPKQEQLQDTAGIHNFDLPDGLYRADFKRDVDTLISGGQVERQEYTFNNSLKAPSVLQFKAAPIILLEGIFVFHYEEIRNLLDLKIFLHAKENLKVIRRIKRDRVERNYPLEDVLYRYEKHVLPTFERYIKPYQEEADIVINNNAHFDRALEVVLAFLKAKIKENSRQIGME